MKSSKQNTRKGFTFLELITATAMLAALSTSCMVIVRTSYTSWNRHEDDHATRHMGLAVLQHIVRHARQAKGAISISASTDTSGQLKLLDTDGDVLVWDHNSSTKEVRFGVTSATDVLATGVEELTFVGYKTDGTTQTTAPGLIHIVECSAKVNVTRPSSTEAVITSSRAWLRSW